MYNVSESQCNINYFGIMENQAIVVLIALQKVDKTLVRTFASIKNIYKSFRLL